MNYGLMDMPDESNKANKGVLVGTFNNEEITTSRRSSAMVANSTGDCANVSVNIITGANPLGGSAAIDNQEPAALRERFRKAIGWEDSDEPEMQRHLEEAKKGLLLRLTELFAQAQNMHSELERRVQAIQ